MPKAAHDVKPVLHALRARGWTLGGLTSDTALAAYLAKPGQRTFDLADLALRYLRRELRTEEPADGQLSLLGGEEEADARAAEQEMLAASAIAELADALDADLAERGGSELLADLELPLAFVLADCEAAGIAVDGETLSDLESDFGTQVREAARQAYEVIGKEINLGSPKQLQVVLFDELEMPKTKRTKTGYTTDADALASLYAQTEHPFLQFLLQHRDATRLKVTVDGLMKSVAEDGRIHTTYSQTIAATGRLSSTDPNLQNVPIRTAAGRRIRDAFVVGSAPDGTPYAELLTADYSQIEMRIMAHLSEDAALIEAFRSQHDFHAETAARVFGVAATEVTPEQRAKIKAMNYGLAYGLSAYGLSGQLRISTEEAKGLMDDYFAGFGGVRDYLAGVVDQARKDGYTATILGRRRYLPDLTSDNRQRREMAERMALNAPIQGSAADIIKVAMLGVYRALQAEGCAAGCCCRCTTSSSSRSPRASARPWRRSCVVRWRLRRTCRCRWRCRSGPAGAGTPRRTDPRQGQPATAPGVGAVPGPVPRAGTERGADVPVPGSGRRGPAPRRAARPRRPDGGPWRAGSRRAARPCRRCRPCPSRPWCRPCPRCLWCRPCRRCLWCRP